MKKIIALIEKDFACERSAMSKYAFFCVIWTAVTLLIAIYKGLNG